MPIVCLPHCNEEQTLTIMEAWEEENTYLALHTFLDLAARAPHAPEYNRRIAEQLINTYYNTHFK